MTEEPPLSDYNVVDSPWTAARPMDFTRLLEQATSRNLELESLYETFVKDSELKHQEVMVNFTNKDIETKMHTSKINQGNIALKRDFFEDAKSKILMILCESPNPKKLHMPISTLEYGAKAKGIVHGTQTPVKDKARGGDFFSAVMLGSRIAAMDREEEVVSLRAKLELMKGSGSETNDMEDWSL
ncbi:hypothetical protein RJ641_028366 [Dillenia turbinata]|uniref:Uncharacterized protein n=1 Tax=Dillenia turbinata TaxID=194707 RepID=A0AAN8ZIY6_9MAGN